MSPNTGTGSSSHVPQFIHVGDVVPRPAFMKKWEEIKHTRLHWLAECIAEFVGVFLYTYLGVGATAAFIVTGIANEPTAGSLLTVGAAYGLGVVLALTVVSSTSGGHLNPCVTIAFTIFKGFPIRKVPRYIISQILGAYVACLLVYLQWKVQITAAEAALEAAGKLDAIQFTPTGPGGILGLYPPAGSNLGNVFANEFFVDFVLGLTIWACLDPSNFFSPPSSAIWIVGFAYGAVIWGYAPVGLAANSARDIGGRLAALTIYGTKASGGRYAALAALTNILSTILAAAFHELWFTDHHRVLPPANRDFLLGHLAHLNRVEAHHGVNHGHSTAVAEKSLPSHRPVSSRSSDMEEGVKKQDSLPI